MSRTKTRKERRAIIRQLIHNCLGLLDCPDTDIDRYGKKLSIFEWREIGDKVHILTQCVQQRTFEFQKGVIKATTTPRNQATTPEESPETEM